MATSSKEPEARPPPARDPGPFRRTDIAVIGLSCRFPGEAKNIDGLWTMLSKGRNAWSEIPATRMNIKGYYHPDPSRQGSFNFRGAHFLEDDVAGFDASFFSIAHHEAVAMDPQQRILLETTYEAMESAGTTRESLDGTNTSVFIGSFVKDYEQVCLRDQDNTPQYAATGNGIAILANRISHCFNLSGTSQTIDTGCSASLVAIHQACQSLISGECDTSIAGGVGLILTPNTIMPMTSLGFLSPDGRSYAFDARANGYGRGEGAGIVILRRLEDAIAAGDTIRSVIRVTTSNQDGRTPGITLPSIERQVANIKQAYDRAGLNPTRTGFVECHGTGTQAGDVREMNAIYSGITSHRLYDDPLYIGSIKTNIGHLEGAAGVAGLIKAVMVVEKGYIPQHINFQVWNPSMFHRMVMKVELPEKLTRWKNDGLRRASINCFGFGGTNAHAIVDDGGHCLSERGLSGYHSSVMWTDGVKPQRGLSRTWTTRTEPHLFLFSAHERERVHTIGEQHMPCIQGFELEGMRDMLVRYEYTLSGRRTRLPWKSYVLARSPDDLIQQVIGGALMNPVRSLPSQAVRVALIFCGQGAQWHAMGRELLQYSAYRSSLQAADAYLREELGSRFSLFDELQKNQSSTLIDATYIAQPAMTALQIALVDLLRASGVEFAAVLGHSSGEIAAAYAAGIIDKKAAWKIAYWRGKSVHIWHQSENGQKSPGAMLAAALSEQQAEELLKEVTPPGSVQIACVNGPQLVTFSGDVDGICLVEEALAARGVFHRMVKVDVAYHSHHMQQVTGMYMYHIGDVFPRKPPPGSPAMYSSLKGDAIENPLSLGAQFWGDNLRAPVNFFNAARMMCQITKPDIVVEVGPQPVLCRTMKEIMQLWADCPTVPCLSMLSKNVDGVSSVLRVLGELFVQGVPINLRWHYMQATSEDDDTPRPPQHIFDLPAYPWNHTKKFWSESEMSKANRFRSHGREDLIGAPQDGGIPGEHGWRGYFRMKETPWIAEHQVQRTVMYPAAGMIAMAVEAAKQLAEKAIAGGSASRHMGNGSQGAGGVAGYEITHFEILAPIIIPYSGSAEDSTTALQHAMSVRPADGDDGRTGGWLEFSLFTRNEGLPATKHARGRFRIVYKGGDAADAAADSKQLVREKEAKELIQKYTELKEACDRPMNPRQLYEGFDDIGLSYGPLFRNMVALRKPKEDDAAYGRGGGKKETPEHVCVAEVKIPNTRACMPYEFEFPHVIHPATLDAMLHPIVAMGNPDDGAMVPCSAASIYISADCEHSAGEIFQGYATVVEQQQHQRQGQALADVVMFMPRPRILRPAVVIRGLELRSVGNTAGYSGFLPNHRNLCSELVWAEDVTATATTNVDEWVRLMGHRNPAMSVLHVGEQMDSTAYVLRLLSPSSSNDGGGGSGGEILAAATAGASTPHFSSVTVTKIEPQVFARTSARIFAGNESTSSKAILSRIELSEDVLDKAHLNPADPSAVSLFDFCILGSAFHICEQGVRESLRPGAFVLVGFDAALPLEGETSETDPPLLGVANWHDTEELLHKSGYSDVRLLACAQPPCSERLARQYAVARKDPMAAVRNDEKNKNKPSSSSLASASKQSSSDSDNGLLVYFVTPHEAPSAKLRALIELLTALFMRPTTHTSSSDPSTLAPVSDDDSNSGGGGGVSGGAAEMRCHTLPLSKVFIAREKVAKIREAIFVSLLEVEQPFVFDLIQPAPPTEDTADAAATDKKGKGKSTSTSKNQEEDYKFLKELLSLANKMLWVSGGAGQMDVRDPRFAASVGLIRTVRSEDLAGQKRFVMVDVDLQGVGVNAMSMSRGGSNKEETIERIAKDIADVFQVEFSMAPHGGRAGADGGETEYVVRGGKRYIPRLEPMDAVNDLIQKGGSSSSRRAAAEPKIIIQDAPLTGASSALFAAEEEDKHKHKHRHQQTTTASNSAASLKLDESSICGGGVSGAENDNVFFTADADAGRILKDGEVRSIAGSLTRPKAPSPEEGSYVVVGGLGGLGRSIASLLIACGARHVVFLSRSGAGTDPGSAARKFLDEQRERGVAQCYSYKVDVCDAEAMKKTLEKMVVDRIPAVKGVIQCAAVLKDATFDNMSYSTWAKAARPKMLGSWNLHKLLPPKDLDFFILLSSAVGILGNRGQANYAAGNTFQDALALHRSSPSSSGSSSAGFLGSSSYGGWDNKAARNRNNTTVSLDLGMVLDVGMVAEDEKLLDIMRANGFFGVRLRDVHFLVKRAISSCLGGGSSERDLSGSFPPQVVTAMGTGGLAAQNKPVDPYWQRLRLHSRLNQVDFAPVGAVHPANALSFDAMGNGSGGGSGGRGMAHLAAGNTATGLRVAIRNATKPEDAVEVATGALARALARLMGMPVTTTSTLTSASAPSSSAGDSREASSSSSGQGADQQQQCPLDVSRSTLDYGVDSLVKLNFTRWIADNAGVAPGDVDEYASLRALGAKIAELVLASSGGNGSDDDGNDGTGVVDFQQIGDGSTWTGP